MDAFAQVGLVLAHISVTLPSSQQFHDGIKTITVTQTPHSVDPVHTLQKGINNTGPLPRIEDRVDIITTDIPVVGEISSLTKVPVVESLQLLLKPLNKIVTDATTAMNLAILHVNACMLRNRHLTITPRLMTHALREKKRVPGQKQHNNNASFQFSNQDHQTASEADEFDEPEMDYMMPFFDDEVLNI